MYLTIVLGRVYSCTAAAHGLVLLRPSIAVAMHAHSGQPTTTLSHHNHTRFKTTTMSDDSDSDSDYSPEADAEEEQQQDSSKALSGLTFSRKRKAEEAWASMVEEDNAAVRDRMDKCLRPTNINRGKKSKRKRRKIQNLMSQIFGSGIKMSTESTEKMQSSSERDGKSDVGVDQARSIVQKLQRNTKVVETKKFAGQSIQIERTVKVGESKPVPTPSEPSSSLDKVIGELKGPQVVSTVTKSSMDWDGYKDKEGLEEDLAQASKEGYLTRKDFLERCDVREFEKERDQRLLNASKKK